MNDKVLEKLRKLLTLAQRGATEGEMAAAMEKAQLIAIQHNIDLATVSTAGEINVGKLEVGADTVRPGTKGSIEKTYHRQILAVLRVCFGVRWVMNSYTNASSYRVINKITFIGEKTDVAMAQFCWTWLEGLMPRLWLEYRKASGQSDGWLRSQNYYHGLALGIMQANKRAVAQLPKQDADRFALVVVNKDQLAKQLEAQLFPKLKNMSTSPSELDERLLRDGFARGREIKLSRPLEGGSTPNTLR